MTQQKKFYDVLDGLRGTAAAAIVMRHSGLYWTSPFLLPSSYLAVDLFFVLSGFVLAHAYEARFAAGMDLVEFIRVRVIRLLPLNLLGLLIGLLLYLGLQTVHHSSDFSTGFLIFTIVLNAFFLPMFPAWGVRSFSFPFNGPTWSLFFEMIVNVLFGATQKWLSLRVLFSVVGCAACALVATSLFYGSLDEGIQWYGFPGGFARVMFSFPLGVVIYRCQHSITPFHVNPWFLLGCLALILWMPVNDTIRPIYDVTAAMVILPSLVAIGARLEPTPSQSRIFTFLGLTSYATYILHFPCVPLLGIATHHVLGIDAQSLAPWSGVAFLGLVFLSAWIIDRMFDEPARKFLTRIGQQATVS